MFQYWRGYKFLEIFSYPCHHSAIKIELKCRNPWTGKSTHVYIRHFFVKESFDKKYISVEYCPTDNMLAYYFTRNIQGQLFNKLRNIIMGYKKKVIYLSIIILSRSMLKITFKVWVKTIITDIIFWRTMYKEWK